MRIEERRIDYRCPLCGENSANTMQFPDYPDDDDATDEETRYGWMWRCWTCGTQHGGFSSEIEALADMRSEDE